MRCRIARMLLPLLGATSVASGCAASFSRAEETLAADLRHDLHERANELVIPFAVDEQWVKKARSRLLFTRSEASKAELLIEGLVDERLFGVEYREAQSLTANEALEQRLGNCFSYAAIVVGVARALGLRADFGEFDEEIQQTPRWSMLVRSGHITAVILTKDGYVAMEYGRSIARRRWRVISDREAVAHYYNNLGFMRLVEAEKNEEAPPWEAAIEAFSLATTIAPTFYRAWNNLGVAMAQLGRDDEALRHYREALRHDPKSSPTHLNVGVLLLRRGDLPGALRSFQRASELRPDDDRARLLVERTVAQNIH